jgi:manganese efflux pump family protein
MTYSQLLLFLMIGTGLSFDSFAVSVSCGLVKKQISFRQAVPVAASLAFFQALFPVIGWYAGIKLNHLIGSFDHWLAFLLLAFIGFKMIAEGSREQAQPGSFNPFSLRVVLGLSIATSIDALVVGLSFGFLDMAILYPVVIIAMVTFLASMLGMLCGKSIPAKLSRQSLIMGGVVLTVIGIKILAEHIWLH